MTKPAAALNIEALIVSYNTRDILTECLEAVRRAGVSAAVLDNDSHDGSADMVAEYFPWVRLVRSNTNLGFGAANNFLAATSDAEFLLLLNSDAILTPEAVPRLHSALVSDEAAVATGPRLIYPDGLRQPSNQLAPSLRFEIARTLERTRFNRLGRWSTHGEIDRVMQWSWRGTGEPERTEVLWATCWLLRAEDFRNHGLFDPRLRIYDEDIDYCVRMKKGGRTFLYVPDAVVVHYSSRSSETAHRTALRRDARYQYYLIQHGIAYAWLYRSLRDTITVIRQLRSLFSSITRWRR